MKSCSVSACESKYYAKGFCKKHYNHNHQYGDPLEYKKGFTREEKFWSHVDIKGADDCWEWQAYKTPERYGQMGTKINGRWKSEGAHRISYRIHFGEIPDGMFVCHHCDNPPCVNPNHLFVGDAASNLQDMSNKGRGRGRCSGMDKTILCQHHGSPYFAKGLCRRCYMKKYYRENRK